MWASERFRNLVSQLALVALIAAVAGYAAHNLVHNLESRSITIGFSYLSQEAGFDISEKLLEYDPTHSYGRAFVVGLLNTLFVSAVAIVAASVLGLAIGIARLSPNWLLAKLAGMYIESVRNVPLILQLLLWYGVITDVLPSAAEALRIGPAYLSQRGLSLPWPEAHAGWSAALLGLVIAFVATLAVVALGLRDSVAEGPCAGRRLARRRLLPRAAGDRLGAVRRADRILDAGARRLRLRRGEERLA